MVKPKFFGASEIEIATLEKLCELLNSQLPKTLTLNTGSLDPVSCLPIYATHACGDDGKPVLGAAPLCVFSFNPETAILETADMSKGVAGQNPADKLTEACTFACTVHEICNDSPDTPLVLGLADLVPLSDAAGVYYPDGTPIAAGDAVTGFQAQLLSIGDEVTKDDGSTYVTQGCDGAVAQSDTATAINMEPGGIEVVGNNYGSPSAGAVDPAAVVDYPGGGSITVAPESGMRVLVFRGRCGPVAVKGKEATKE